MDIWVVLPAFNEEENLPQLLEAFKSLESEAYNTDIHILVVDDGSTDRTFDIATSFADKLSVEVFQNEKNMGLAYTFSRGISIAAEKAGAKDIIICMDADNSHPAGLALRMIRYIREGRDIVIASRYQNQAVVKGVPLSRRFLSYGMSILFRIVCPIPGVKDYSCGYRAYRAAFLQNAMANKGKQLFAGEGFSCMAGFLLSLAGEGAVCGEVPIILRYDKKKGSSKMNVLKTIGNTMAVMIHAKRNR